MIKINLLKQVSRKRKRGVSFLSTGIAVVVGLAVVVAGAGMMRWWLQHPRPPVAVQQQTDTVQQAGKTVAEKATAAVPETTAITQQAASQQQQPKKAVPETTAVTQRGAVETTAGFLDSRVLSIEKINYEISFAKKVLQELTDAVPEGIGFSSISIDSFKTVSAEGLGSMRENVSTFFSNLRRLKGFQLLEFPFSSIRLDPSSKDFQFQCKCRVSFDTSRTPGRLFPTSRLPLLLKTFLNLAKRGKLAVRRHGLVRKSVLTSGGYRQTVYHFSCGGTYRDFVKFVQQVDEAHLSCAFSAIQIKVSSEAVIEIGSDVIFTTRK